MTTLNLIVAAGLDDNRISNGALLTTSPYDTAGTDFGVELSASMRFLNATIPNSAIITSCTLTMNASISKSDTTFASNIGFEAADNPAQIADYATFLTRRANIGTPAAWNAFNTTANADFTSPSLVSQLQAIVNRAGWASGNALMVFFVNNGSPNTVWRSAWSYEHSVTVCPRLNITYDTAPTITAGPTTTYATLTRTGPSNTWGVTFTAHDAEQTGAGAITYYVYTGASRTGSQIATGTCTSDSSKVITALAYNIAGLANGSNTLYLSVYDGTVYSADSSFTLLRDDTAPTASTVISTTPSPVV